MTGVEPVGEAPRDRLGLHGLDYRIPEAADRWPYMLGGLTAALLLMLLLTGLYLEQYYQPNPVGARDSVLYIITRAPLGDWIRSLHYWSAGALTITIPGHLGYVFWRRSYRKPREVTWWAGVALGGLVFLLMVTGIVLRGDQEGFESLAHLSGGGKMLQAVGGSFFTDAFTPSTSLLARMFTLHTSLLPLLTILIVGLHFWLIRQLGINADASGTAVFRDHLIRLSGLALLLYALIGVLAVAAPEGLGYPPVPGMEVTKPFWPLLWVYGLENVSGMWGMVIGPAVLAAFLVALPLVDRGSDDRPGIRSPVGWVGVLIAVLVVGFWLYGRFGAAQAHLGM